MRANLYRTHTCGELRTEHAETSARLSGWIHTVRDHRGVVFLSLRDHYGQTQVVFDDEHPEARDLARHLHHETVVRIEGEVRPRPEGTENQALATGAVEVHARSIDVLSTADLLPFQVARDDGVHEDLRLTYRFLDLRRERMQRNLKMRARVVSFIRSYMERSGFLEVHTPILANSSPEGARDYLVPSRVHPGMFYALPQAPQQFKQLLMVSGVDRYYQIAPCFRDEDARADRSPGEFYQLDLEMAFAEQEDVFDAVEPLMIALTEEVGGKRVKTTPFPRLTYRESLERFGNDKPDMRFGMEIADLTGEFVESEFGTFAKATKGGGGVRAISVPGAAAWTRSAIKRFEDRARALGAGGLVVVGFDEGSTYGLGFAKFFSRAEIDALATRTGAGKGDLVWVCASARALDASRVLGILRVEAAEILGLRDPNVLAWGWITDFPMFERDEATGKVDFSHNPFSMPKGGLEALDSMDPTEISANQYDIFCNGLELSSGAVRNYSPEVMYRAFEIAGYDRSEVDARFGHMIAAFRFGAPPHAGIAPGIERLVMLLAGEPNLREVVPFPKNQHCRDLMLGAPSAVPDAHLAELHITLVPPESGE
ncbi:MAG: aspartate--tRNA ligase [Blastocatellia bacterium]|jgi:aspartyl-tRNA synthetase|nr:aspartate--tRNA ligase [Blastocatellia bacterium]MBK6428694.1 aspartate--tRNA ligase [Blastocatellia bacterium]